MSGKSLGQYIVWLSLLGGGVKPLVLRSGRKDQWKSSSCPQPRPNISLLLNLRLLAGGGAFTLDLDLTLLGHRIQVSGQWTIYFL